MPMAVSIQFPAVVKPVPLPVYVKAKLDGFELRQKARDEKRDRQNARRRKPLDR